LHEKADKKAAVHKNCTCGCSEKEKIVEAQLMKERTREHMKYETAKFQTEL
jgi:hypothetical protein